MSDGANWSEWLDFTEASVKETPEMSGVFVMHADMKIFFIGGSENLRKTLLEYLSKPCLQKTKRFKYLITPSYEKIRGDMLKEYIVKHNGKLPLCMEKE